MLGGSSDGPLPRVAKELTQDGVTMENWFVHTPVCCPSRSEIITGRMFHNLAFKASETNKWDTQPNGMARQCMHIDENNLSPGPTFAGPLAAAGYRVGFFGKYLNISPKRAPTGAHTYFVNPGPEKSPFDSSGEYYPNYWYHISPTYNGTFNFTGLPMGARYETAFIGNTTTKWLTDAANSGQPFFAYIAPHAPHGAAIPAPWYQTEFPNKTAPRTPSFGVHGSDHHWLVAQQPPVTQQEITSGDSHYRDRWRCLLSVDDLIVALRDTLRETNVLDSTYFFYTSDHGFHFHELRLGVGKWNVYDTDVRVHMYVTGPGIMPGQVLSNVASHIDLAPTWLGLAGVATPTVMDGRSIVSQLITNTSDVRLPASVHRSLAKEAQADAGSRGTRPTNAAYIEYHGLGPVGAPKRWMDSLNNTYRAIRIISGNQSHITMNSNGQVSGNLLYAEFASDYGFDSVVFKEVYNLAVDPWQIHNIANTTDPAMMSVLGATAQKLWTCAGPNCR